MSGPWVHPRVFVLVLKLENGVGDDKLMFCAQGEESEAIRVHAACAMVSYGSPPQFTISANTGIKVTQQDYLVSFADVLQNCIKCTVKVVLGLFLCD